LLTEKDRYKLIHPCVREEQVGRVRHQAGRNHYAVLFGFKKIQERLSYLVACHHVSNSFSRDNLGAMVVKSMNLKINGNQIVNANDSKMLLVHGPFQTVNAEW